ncbi:ABC-type transport auxiliary lipoprotein family protein [Sphingomonas sp. CA1-15]|uniref:ABC-type transport auxiliary lipoprotein family protein n=2 Tax=Sphingomonas immobilis TaxID=3063997 RepID=A0ABT8ZZW5_9SPHN|nr:ABC-type transport auxiliary lipoprotein family protein [Sphingomonas sp. CA1-15]
MLSWAALPFALSGCISLSPKPPAQLLTLTSSARIPVGGTQNSASAATIVIQNPLAAASLSGVRVPVQMGETAIAYVPKAQWVEPPSRLFQRMLAETVAARTGRVVLSNRQFNADPGAALQGELKSFGIDAGTKEAVVAYDGALTRKDPSVIEKRRFEARVPVAAIDALGSSAALNQAANQVAGEVADWVGK